MIHFIVPADQVVGIEAYLEHWGKDVANRFRVLHYESLVARTQFEPGTYVLSALDQLSSGMLVLVGELHERLQGVEGFRFVNHPARTLRRRELLSELYRCRRNSFRAVGATESLNDLRYPVFLRSARAHIGPISPLLQSGREVEQAIGNALVQGYALGDLLVVEFCDTADSDGVYRKYAAFAVGSRVIARSLAYGREWMLKFHSTEFSRTLAEEERDYVCANPHAGELQEIFRMAGVEYGRIDYALRGDHIETWEINLNPTIGRGLAPSKHAAPRDLEPIRQEAKECFYRGFEGAWEAVDLVTSDGPAAFVEFDARTLRGIRAENDAAAGRWLAHARAMLHPVKPLLMPMIRRAEPIIGRIARRVASP